MTGAGLEDLLEDLISEEIALSGEKGETPLPSNRSLSPPIAAMSLSLPFLTLPYQYTLRCSS